MVLRLPGAGAGGIDPCSAKKQRANRCQGHDHRGRCHGIGAGGAMLTVEGGSKRLTSRMKAMSTNGASPMSRPRPAGRSSRIEGWPAGCP